MRLAPILASLPDGDLDRLAAEHVRTDEKLARPQLCTFLEGAIRSYPFVQDFVINRQPPTFSFLTLLLDAPGYELAVEGLSARVLEDTKRIMDLIDSGEVLGRDNQLQLYRRALFEARRSDLDVNPSEAALLAVLRRESRIAQVEHFLIEHHQDLREFWDKDDSFFHEEKALRSAGLVFLQEGKYVIAQEVAPALFQTLGVDMPTDAARRLLSYLSSSDYSAALEQIGSRTAGSKETRLERIMTERIQPHVVLRSVSLPTLKDICRDAGASPVGNKDDLIDRIIGHFSQGKDQPADEPAAQEIPEQRRLGEEQFNTLFGFLLHHELSDILRRFPDLRQTGSKETKIRTLWQASLSEETLLSELMNRDLEAILHRLSLRLGGSKNERIGRILEYFTAFQGTTETSVESDTENEAATTAAETSADVLGRQEAFRQKAASPQSSLQPWLEDILSASGLIRCYATEDDNPTKQLKNKLSQAAVIRGGLLVLLLNDEDAFLKAHEALVERWMTNEEWSKSVAAVALAYPLGAPVVRSIVESIESTFSERLRTLIFPSAGIVKAIGDRAVSPPSSSTEPCSQCRSRLPVGARFCPECGNRVLS
jgi:hypothetical protein